MSVAPSSSSALPAEKSLLLKRYSQVRQQSEALSSHLSDSDMTVQSMPDASPTKWHLAHTTWFFEAVILKRYLSNYRVVDDNYAFLFNSYYESIGPRNTRSRRGMITRPSVEEVYAYRRQVDETMAELLETRVDVGGFLEIGCHHEQQHQELMLMDILHLLAQNPIKPAFQAPKPLPAPDIGAPPLEWLEFEGGIYDVGAETGNKNSTFAYDCEKPRHQVLLRPFRLANRLVTNGEWLEFMQDNGYGNPTLWLSDGIATVRSEGWCAPCYWEKHEGQWQQMSLCGLQAIDNEAPVSHISYFEADAFARWAGKRLPLEHEWESAAQDLSIAGNFVDSGRLRAGRAVKSGENSLLQMYGDLWEWSGSPYSPYPGFECEGDMLSEYNGKFMCGQFVLKGGCCVTPADHMRVSYRNFYYPQQRWMFSGLRMAKDLT